MTPRRLSAPRVLQARITLARVAPWLAIASVLLVGLGSILTVDAYGARGPGVLGGDPGSQEVRTETRVVSTWVATGAFEHSATVTNGTAAFPTGTVLTDRSVYFSRVSPTLDGQFVYGYDDSAGGTAAVTVTVGHEYSSVEGVGEEATVYWRVEDTVATVGPRSLRAGDRLTVPFAANVTAAAGRLGHLDREVGGSPGLLQFAVLARVNVTTADGGAATGTYRLPVTVEGNTYTVRDGEPVVETTERTERVAVPVTAGPVRGVGGPLLVALGAVGLAGLAVAFRTGAFTVTDAERATLSNAAERAEYGDWITVGTLPDGAFDEATVRVDSLAGLVDLAIDTDSRVVEDTVSGRFFVPGERFDYVYVPADPSDTATGEGVGDTDRHRQSDARRDRDGDTDPVDGETTGDDRVGDDRSRSGDDWATASTEAGGNDDDV